MFNPLLKINSNNDGHDASKLVYLRDSLLVLRKFKIKYMKRPLVYPLERNANPEMEEMAKFYEETLGFTPNSLFTMMHRPRISAAFLEMNKAVMENKGRVTSAL